MTWCIETSSYHAHRLSGTDQYQTSSRTGKKKSNMRCALKVYVDKSNTCLTDLWLVDQGIIPNIWSSSQQVLMIVVPVIR